MIPSVTLVVWFGAVARATPITYEQALEEALQANATVLGSLADVRAAEGAVFGSTGSWDPLLTGSWTADTSRAEFYTQQFGLLDTETRGQNWSVALGQTLPTGTSWQASWRGGFSSDRARYTLLGEPIEAPSTDNYDSSFALSLTQQLLRGHKLAYNLQAVDAARRAASTAEASLQATRQSVLAATARAYWDLVTAQQVESTASQAVEVAVEERRYVAAQVAAGNLAPVEATRVETAVAQAEIALLDARGGVEAASQALAVTLGRSLGVPLEPATLPGDVPMGLDVDVDAAVAAALAGNPGMALRRLALEAAESELTLARHGRLPSLSVTGVVGTVGVDADVYETDFLTGESTLQTAGAFGTALSDSLSGDYWNGAASANLSVPLRNRAARGAVDSRAAEVDGARRALEEEEGRVAQQAAAQVRVLSGARERLRLAELNLRLAEETLVAEEARQDAGRAILKDVLAAQRARDDAEVALIRARTDVRKALVELKALQGAL